MVDLSKVSQRVINQFKEITRQDGKKGISNAEERAAVANLLAGLSGNYDIDFVNSKIAEYDLEEAQKNASKDVVGDIERAKKMDGDKNSIDSEKEIAVLDSIIDNSYGDYSPDDIEYAKLVKKQFGLTEETPLSVEREINEELSADLEIAEAKIAHQKECIENLEKALTDKDAEIQKAIADGKIKSEEIENLKAQLAEMKAKLAPVMTDPVELGLEPVKADFDPTLPIASIPLEPVIVTPKPVSISEEFTRILGEAIEFLFLVKQ